MTNEYPLPLTEYAKRYGWHYRTLLRAKARGWPIDRPKALLSLALAQTGPPLRTDLLRKLVSEESTPPTPAPDLIIQDGTFKGLTINDVLLEIDTFPPEMFTDED